MFESVQYCSSLNDKYLNNIAYSSKMPVNQAFQEFGTKFGIYHKNSIIAFNGSRN